MSTGQVRDWCDELRIMAPTVQRLLSGVCRDFDNMPVMKGREQRSLNRRLACKVRPTDAFGASVLKTLAGEVRNEGQKDPAGSAARCFTVPLQEHLAFESENLFSA